MDTMSVISLARFSNVKEPCRSNWSVPVKKLNLCLEIFILCSCMALYPANFKVSDINIVDFESSIYISKIESKTDENCPAIKMNKDLWQYLRQGLNYLEASGQNYPPDFVHPGAVAFGPLGLSKVAVEDVFERFPSMSRFSANEVFKDPLVYENFAKCYADLLLRHYLGLDYWTMDKKEVFDVLQRAWFLGPNLYKQGASIIASRERRARNFIETNQNPVM
jgi:hypothetical protein